MPFGVLDSLCGFVDECSCFVAVDAMGSGVGGGSLIRVKLFRRAAGLIFARCGFDTVGGFRICSALLFGWWSGGLNRCVVGVLCAGGSGWFSAGGVVAG